MRTKSVRIDARRLKYAHGETMLGKKGLVASMGTAYRLSSDVLLRDRM